MTAVRSAWVMGVVGCCLVAAPAQANNLVNWRFDRAGNRLELSTFLPTQPQVQVLSNPPRLVVDLPDTVLGRPPEARDIPQLLGRKSPVRQVRLAQFDPQTTRLVVELHPDYVLTPEQIQSRMEGMNQWVFTLPRTLARTNLPPANLSPTNLPPATPAASVPQPTPLAEPPAPGSVLAPPVVKGVRVTDAGLALRVQGNPTVTQMRRSPDRQEIWVDIPATLSPQFQTETLNLSQLGILRVQAQQLQNQPPLTRVTLQVDGNSPDWQMATQGSDIVMLPKRNRFGPEAATAAPVAPSRPLLPSPVPVVDGVDWDVTNQQVLIRANRPLRFTQSWEREAGLNFASLRMVLSAARLSPRAEQALRNIPGMEVDVETSANQVTLIWRPSQEVRVIGIQEVNPQLLAVQLLSTRTAQIQGLSPLARWLNRRPATPRRPAPPRPANPAANLPRPIPGRPIVVIDPGHGGPDPGAVGIGGLRETFVVNDISHQVVELLEQQGVQVVMTRREDVDLGLTPRVALARRVNATLFVSIHANAISMSRPEVNGIETFYFHPASFRLAQVLQRAKIQATGVRDRGVKRARFYVIRNTPPDMPSVLLEVGFVTGTTDARMLASAEGRRTLAQAIARGILSYLQARR